MNRIIVIRKNETIFRKSSGTWCYNEVVKIKFSDHARIQIKRRNIPETLIIKGVKEYERMIKSYRGRSVRQMYHQNAMLEIVTITEDSIITVITAYYLDSKE